MVSWELIFEIAGKLDDPEIRAAGEAREPRFGYGGWGMNTGYGWRFWGVERKNWPIYNWIDDYVEEIDAER